VVDGAKERLEKSMKDQFDAIFESLNRNFDKVHCTTGDIKDKLRKALYLEEGGKALIANSVCNREIDTRMNTVLHEMSSQIVSQLFKSQDRTLEHTTNLVTPFLKHLTESRDQ